MTSKASGDDHLLHIVKAQPDTFQEDLAARIDCGLGANQVFDIDLRENDILLDRRLVFSDKDVFIAIRSPPNSVGGEIPAELSRSDRSCPWPASSATASIRPEPQIPIGVTLPIVKIIGSKVRGWMLTSSMAPRVALIPNRIPAPSKAGPAEQETLASQSLFPKTISPLVPISM